MMKAEFQERGDHEMSGKAESKNSSYAKCVSWNPDGTLLAAGFEDGSIRILKADQPDLVLSKIALEGHGEEVESGKLVGYRQRSGGLPHYDGPLVP